MKTDYLLIGALAAAYLYASNQMSGSGDVDNPDGGDPVGDVLGTVGGLVSFSANTYSDACTALTQQSEGCSLTAYPDAGGYSIGWGHFGATAGETITQDQADSLLASDLTTASNVVNNLVQVDITQPMFDALTDFTFNVGGGHFASSTLLAKVNASDWQGALAQFPRWIYSKGVVVQALVTRRANEAALFQSGIPSQ